MANHTLANRVSGIYAIVIPPQAAITSDRHGMCEIGFSPINIC